MRPSRFAPVGFALASLTLGWGVASARDIEITRACFPGFCVESRAAFTTLARNEAAGTYRLLLSRTQSVLYIEAGETPDFPKCAQCEVETRAREHHGERVARQNRSGHIMGRLFGPLNGCQGAAPFYVHVFVYLPEANPGAIVVERQC